MGRFVRSIAVYGNRAYDDALLELQEVATNAGYQVVAVNGLLRGELGFQGLVMSDWWSVYDPMLATSSGLDIEMPGAGAREPTTYLTRDVPAYLEDGRIPVSNIDAMVKHTLTAQFMMGFDKRDIAQLPVEVDYAAHEQWLMTSKLKPLPCSRTTSRSCHWVR